MAFPKAQDKASYWAKVAYWKWSSVA